MRKKHITQKQLAEMCDMKQSNISGFLTGKRPIGMNVCQRIADALGVSYEWIMFGESNTKTLNNTIAPNVFDNEVFECGFPVGESGAITQSSMENTIILPNAPQDIIYIRAHGNSMVSEDSHQSIPDGAYVALRKKQTKVIQWGEVYALATRDGMILKKLMPSDKNGCVKCVSNNKDFPPFDISTQDIIDIAIVVGVIAISWLAR